MFDALGRFFRSKTVRETGFNCSVSVAAGKKGVASGWVGGGLQVTTEDARTGKREVNPFGAAGVSTAVGGVGYMAGKNHGWYGGINAPYVSYGRGNPLLGDTLSLNIPLVGSATIAREGGIGGQLQFDLWGVHPGGSVFVMSPALRGVTEPVFDELERVAVPVEHRVEAELRPYEKYVELSPQPAPTKPATCHARVVSLAPTRR